jgi:hypothetical protein
MQNLQNNPAGVRELVETLIDECGWPATEVRQRARILREAGMLPTSKRGGGVGKAPITAEHCMWLMIAMGATNTNQRATDAARTFAKLIGSPSDNPVPGDGTFLGDMTTYLEWRQRIGFGKEQWHWQTFEFQHDPDWPTVTIIFRRDSDDASEARRFPYTPALDDAFERYEKRFRSGQLTRPTQIDAGIVEVFTRLLGPADRSILDDPEAFRRWRGVNE